MDIEYLGSTSHQYTCAISYLYMLLRTHSLEPTIMLKTLLQLVINQEPFVTYSLLKRLIMIYITYVPKAKRMRDLESKAQAIPPFKRATPSDTWARPKKNKAN